MRMISAFALCALIAAPAVAQTSAHETTERERYLACLERIDVDPANAFEDALAWKFDAGGWPARHCEARALVALGEAEEGASRLEALGHAPDGPTVMRVLFLAEAGEAWLAARRPSDSLRAWSSALDISPDSAPLWLGRARANAALREWTAAEADAGAAIAAEPERLESWRVRAEARLELGRLDAAEADMRQARELDPDDIDTLVIRGRILEARRLGGSSSPSQSEGEGDRP